MRLSLEEHQPTEVSEVNTKRERRTNNVGTGGTFGFKINNAAEDKVQEVYAIESRGV